MRKLKELFRLKFDCQLSNRKTANSCGISRPTVSEYLFRAAQQGLTWEIISELSEEELENRLLQKASPRRGETSGKPWPDFERVHQELKSNKQVTLMLLYEEYRETYPDTHYSHAWFYAQCQNWKKKLDWVMRQDHKGGEKLFLDYCDGPSLVDPKTGIATPTHLFAVVWGASNYTFAEASFSQKQMITELSKGDWLTHHQNILITGPTGIGNWYEVIGEPTLADAICERLFAKAHRIELKGKSLR
jgi:transposase